MHVKYRVRDAEVIINYTSVGNCLYYHLNILQNEAHVLRRGEMSTSSLTLCQVITASDC